MTDLKLYTLQQFNKQYPQFTLGALRSLIFHSDTNGFDKVIIRFSPTGKRGRIFIDVDAFFKWLYEQNNRGEEYYG